PDRSIRHRLSDRVPANTPYAVGCSQAQGPSGASPARSSARQTLDASDSRSPRSHRSAGSPPSCPGPARLEHRPGAASRRSLRACSASLPLQSSLMSKTYLKSDHFNGGGSIGTAAAATASSGVGPAALASNGGAAFGDGAVAPGTTATAVGPGASATFVNSSAFGAGASATAANQMAFGTASNTYRLPGITSAASLAAQSGPTSFVTTDANGNLAATNFGPQNIAGLSASVAALQQGFSIVQENLQHGLNQAYEGTAVAIAMSGSALPDNKRFAITSNWGNFRGTNAMSFIAQARVSDNIVANAAFA